MFAASLTSDVPQASDGLNDLPNMATTGQATDRMDQDVLKNHAKVVPQTVICSVQITPISLWFIGW